jgi:hypothetical protein
MEVSRHAHKERRPLRPPVSSRVRKNALCRPVAGIPARAWMAGTSPAMTQVVEIKVNRHARPCADHPRDPLGMALFIEFEDFFRILLVRKKFRARGRDHYGVVVIASTLLDRVSRDADSAFCPKIGVAAHFRCR